MNRVQKLIDENKDKMPTALAKQLLDACKEEADATKQLYKLTWTIVQADSFAYFNEDEPNHAEVALWHETHTLTVKAVDLPQNQDIMNLPNHGMVFKGWLKHFTKQPCFPLIIRTSDDRFDCSARMVIVHSIVPYESHKRTRKE